MIPETFTYWGYSIGWTTVRHMPERRAYKTFQRFADTAWRRRGRAVLQYEKNLHRVAPDATPEQLRALSRAGFRSYARYWCDAFRMPDWPRERILAMPMPGVEYLEDALALGRGVVFTCPHSGNYDLGAAFVSQRFGRLTTVAERLKPEKLFDKFVAFRESLGMEVLGFGDKDLTGTLEARARSGGIVGLVGDRDLSRRGVPVTFFGEPTRMPAGAGLIARRTGAQLIPGFPYYTPEGPRTRLFPPLDVPVTDSETNDVSVVMQSVANVFEAAISSHPTDWHMLQPLWLSDLDPARLRPTTSPAT